MFFFEGKCEVSLIISHLNNKSGNSLSEVQYQVFYHN